MRFVLVALALCFVLVGCTSLSPAMRADNAKALAFPVQMYPRNVPAGPFKLQSYERVHDRGGPAVIYIEGSQGVMVTDKALNVDPTPTHAVGLELATYDPAPNVIYLARPCQFSKGMDGAKSCPLLYLQGAMFAPEVVAGYMKAFDEIKARYQISGFHVVGYGSGGGLAAILAAKRADILTLRTVGGLLDTQTFARLQNATGLDQSYNPIDFVPQLVGKPQHHYIGQFDRVIPNAVYHSFAQAFADPRCLSYTFVPEKDHDDDWASDWTGYARNIPTCTGPDPMAGERDARIQEMAPKITPKK